MPLNVYQGLYPGMSGEGGLLGGPPQSAVPMPYTAPQASTPGYWSQLAYQMAGSPQQGPYPSVAAPAGIPGSSGGGGLAAGAGLGGLLGLLGQNPGLLKSTGGLLGSALSSLMPSNSSTTGYDTGNNQLNSAASNYLANGDPTYGIPGLSSLPNTPALSSSDASGLLLGNMSNTDPNAGMTDSDYLSMLGFNSAGGQAATEVPDPVASGQLSYMPQPSQGWQGFSNPLGALGQALGLGASIAGGSGLGAASNAVGLGANAGAIPSSTASTLGTGLGLAGAGMNFAGGNVPAGLSNLTGVGAKSGLIPAPVAALGGLALGAFTGNPFAIIPSAVNSAKGLYNWATTGAWSGDPLQPVKVTAQPITVAQLNAPPSAVSAGMPTGQVQPGDLGFAQGSAIDPAAYSFFNSGANSYSLNPFGAGTPTGGLAPNGQLWGGGNTNDPFSIPGLTPQLLAAMQGH